MRSGDAKRLGIQRCEVWSRLAEATRILGVSKPSRHRPLTAIAFLRALRLSLCPPQPVDTG